MDIVLSALKIPWLVIVLANLVSLERNVPLPDLAQLPIVEPTLLVITKVFAFVLLEEMEPTATPITLTKTASR